MNVSEEAYQELVSKSPFRAPIYCPTEKVPLEQRIKGVGEVISLWKNDFQPYYKKKIEILREEHLRYGKSRRCFVIGNGPSINEMDLSLLKDEVVFCANSFFLKFDELDWRPTYYFVEDHLVAEDRADSINELKGFHKFFPIYLRYAIEPDEYTVFYNHRPRVSYPDGFDFSTEANEKTYTGCTVLFSALQFAYYFGFKEIYMLGVDQDYKMPADLEETMDYNVSVLDMESDDPNHFHKDYFGKGYRWHNPQTDKMGEAFAEAGKVCADNGVKIFNAGVGGNLNCYPRVDYAGLF